MVGIYLLSEELLASQEWLCFVLLVGSRLWKWWCCLTS